MYIYIYVYVYVESCVIGQPLQAKPRCWCLAASGPPPWHRVPAGSLRWLGALKPLRSRQWPLPAVVLRSKWSSRTRQRGRHFAMSSVRSPADPSEPFCMAPPPPRRLRVPTLCPGANKVTELVSVIPDVAASSSFDICAVEGKFRKAPLSCSPLSGAVQDWSLMAF